MGHPLPPTGPLGPRLRPGYLAMCKRISHSSPYGPAIAAVVADILGQAIVTPALPFFLSEVSVPEADLPRWNGMIMGTQFAAVVLGSLLSGRMGDKYGSAAAVKLALIGQTFFFALSAFAPFGFVGDPTLAATLLLFTRIGAGVSTAMVSALLYIFDRAPSSEARLLVVSPTLWPQPEPGWRCCFTPAPLTEPQP